MGGRQVRVHVEDQAEPAIVSRDEYGHLTLRLQSGLISADAFCALVAALAPVAEYVNQHLQHTG